MSRVMCLEYSTLYITLNIFQRFHAGYYLFRKSTYCSNSFICNHNIVSWQTGQCQLNMAFINVLINVSAQCTEKN